MSQNLDRKRGFYWVKCSKEEDWEVALWSLNCWSVVGAGLSYSDYELFQIDERIIEINTERVEDK